MSIICFHNILLIDLHLNQHLSIKSEKCVRNSCKYFELFLLKPKSFQLGGVKQKHDV
jgi:hypothetical protein